MAPIKRTLASVAVVLAVGSMVYALTQPEAPYVDPEEAKRRGNPHSEQSKGAASR
jgi:hypothetical protein